MNIQVEAVLRTLPRKIKVGAYDWRIKVDPNDSDDCGETDFDAAQITIWPASHQSPERVVGTVIHELLHVLHDTEEIDAAAVQGVYDEEFVVSALEKGLVGLFRDNPKLLTWIKRGLKTSP